MSGVTAADAVTSADNVLPLNLFFLWFHMWLALISNYLVLSSMRVYVRARVCVCVGVCVWVCVCGCVGVYIYIYIYIYIYMCDFKYTETYHIMNAM